MSRFLFLPVMSVSNFTDEKLLQNWAPSREALGHMATGKSRAAGKRASEKAQIVTSRVSSKIENYMASLRAVKYIPNQGHLARRRDASALIRHFPEVEMVKMAMDNTALATLQ